MKSQAFKELGLSDDTLQALDKKGFEEPTEIQRLTIPLLLKNEKDIVGQAQTGTGKTAAFGLPIIEKLEGHQKHVQALILAPTRELAIQVAEEINSLKGKKRLFVLPVYGGQSIDIQIKSLRRGVDIVVGTPGRIIDHIKRGTLNLSSITHMVLDEADEMLNMGFVDDVEDILSNTSEDKRVLLFSATMPKEILTIAKKYMGGYEVIRTKKKELTTDLTDQIYFEVSERDRFEALCRIIDIEDDFYGMVFCRTKIDVDRLANKLIERGYDAEGLHGDISQFQRERILNKFKSKHSSILVATDVAARGIDVNDVSHVINFSLPQDPEAYVHRIGRTGRAGKQGTAITFVTPSEYRKLLLIQRIAKTDIRKEKLPDVKAIISSKRDRIKARITRLIEKTPSSEYASLADELLTDVEPKDVVAALLHHAFQDELKQDNYLTIREVTIDTTGTARLFVARGREDKMTPKSLVEFITEKTDVDQSKIRDVRIFDKFSFITTPFEEAELILEIFKKNTRGSRPLVTKAKSRPGENQSSGNRRDSRPSGNRRDSRPSNNRRDYGNRSGNSRTSSPSRGTSSRNTTPRRDSSRSSSPRSNSSKGNTTRSATTRSYSAKPSEQTRTPRTNETTEQKKTKQSKPSLKENVKEFFKW